ncbi:hypothetical protein E3P77_00723 [Wallemia ichthyophaga]|nr:hypothetical protein E3P77_00723 [Wallemia ichthyophaga]
MEYKLGYTPRIESSLKSLSPRSLCQTVLDWIDDNKVERPYGDSSSVRIKYSKFSTKPPTKPSLLREIYRDWPAGLSYRQLTIAHFKLYQEKPLSFEWRVYRLKESNFVSLDKFIEIFQRNLDVTHNYTLYMQFLPSTSHSVEQTPIFTLIIHAEPGEELPPPSQRLMFVPLLSAGKLITTAIPSTHVHHIVRAFLSAFGNAEELINLQLYDTNLLSLKTLTLEPKTQGIWRKLASSIDKLPNPLEEAPHSVDSDALISPHDIQPSSIGDGYDEIIQQTSSDHQNRRRYEAMDVWGHESDLPQIHRLTFNVRMPWRIQDETDNLDCKIRMFGDDIYRGLRQAELEGKTTEEGIPGWIPQSLETGHTDNIVVKTSRVTDNWQFVPGLGIEENGDIFGADLDRVDEIEPEMRQPTPSPTSPSARDSPGTRKRKREAPQKVYEDEKIDQETKQNREIYDKYYAPVRLPPPPPPRVELPSESFSIKDLKLKPGLRRAKEEKKGKKNVASESTSTQRPPSAQFLAPEERLLMHLDDESSQKAQLIGNDEERAEYIEKMQREKEEERQKYQKNRAAPLSDATKERLSKLDDRSRRKGSAIVDAFERTSYIERKEREKARADEERRKKIRRESDERRRNRRAEAEQRVSLQDPATAEARVAEAIEKSQRRLEARRARKSGEGVVEPSASAPAPAGTTNEPSASASTLSSASPPATLPEQARSPSGQRQKPRPHRSPN